MADAAQEFCTSVFLGKDWIPRLTVHSFERLRDEMVSRQNRFCVIYIILHIYHFIYMYRDITVIEFAAGRMRALHA